LAYPQRRLDDGQLATPLSWRLACEVKALAAAGDVAAARDRFGELVAATQARAGRIAFAYLRDEAEADEAVQDAFVRVFLRIADYRDELPFEQWFTRILINGCIDRGRARRRRHARVGPLMDADAERVPAAIESVDRQLSGREWQGAVARALEALPERQRMVFAMCHYEDRSSADVAASLGLKESTVRVHLFRAVRKLRAALAEWRHEV
jgi:RNA polymerase sigma-70 factor (ECF subfamily)